MTVPALQPDLIATCWTTAGAALPLSDDERSPEPFVQRVEAAMAVGFRGFGLLHADLVAERDASSLSAMRDVLLHYQVRHFELEMLVDWFADGPRRQRSDEVRTDLLTAARELGAHHVKVGGDFSGVDWPFTRMVREFRALCQHAEEAGTKIALEPVAFSNIPTPDVALRIIEAADHYAGGMMLDVWHVERLHYPLNKLAQLPLSAIVATELDDAHAQVQGSLLDDTIHHRRLCGEGDFDLGGFIAAVRNTGFTGPWGVEIISEEHRSRPMQLAVKDAFLTAMKQFEAQRS